MRRRAEREDELEALRAELSTVDLSSVAETPVCISTGVFAFDLAMGGGFPEGRLSEVLGGWQAGKSLLLLQAIRECQKAGGIAILDDAERALDKRWALKIGVNLDELIYYIAPNLEKGFEHLEKVARAVRKSRTFKDVPILYAKDSLEASIAAEEFDKPFTKPGIAIRARTISMGLRRLTNLIADYRVAVVFANQLRTNVNVMFGNPEESAGGKAPKFYAGLRVAMTKGKRIKKGERVVGINGTLEVIKSKIGTPFRKVKFQTLFSLGIPQMSGLLDFLVREGVVMEVSKTFYKFNDISFRAKEFPKFWEDNANAVQGAYERGETCVSGEMGPEAPEEAEEEET